MVRNAYILSNTNTYHRLLRGLELDMDYSELVYNLHFFKFNIDAWFQKTLTRGLGGMRPVSDWLPAPPTDIRRLLPDPALGESLRALQQLRDFVQACVSAGLRVEIASQNLDEERYACVISPPPNARRARIFNVMSRADTVYDGITRVSATLSVDDESGEGELVQFDMGFTVSKHVLLQFVLNPFWEFLSGDPADNSTDALTLGGSSGAGAPDIMVVDKNGFIDIRCAEGIAFRLDCTQPYMKELFIMRVLNPLFERGGGDAVVDFDRMQASVLAVVKDDRVRDAPKALLWTIYRDTCALLISNRNNYSINPRGAGGPAPGGKRVKWCLGPPVSVSEDALEGDGSIYDLDQAALADVETLRSWKVACNDIYLLIPFLQRSRHAIHLIPHFLVDAPSLPFCKVRHQIIRSFMENRHNGSRYVSSYGYNYLRRRKCLSPISCRGGFVLTPELVRVSETLELLTDSRTSLFDLMAEYGCDAFSASRLGALAACAATDIAKARALLFAVPRSRTWNADLAVFFDKHPHLLFADDRLVVSDVAVSLTSMDIAIDDVAAGGYAEIDARDVLSQFLSSHRITQDNVAPQEWGVPVARIGMHEFFERFIGGGTYLLGSSCLLIDNVQWSMCDGGVYQLLVRDGAVLMYDFDVNIKFCAAGSMHAYVFAGGKQFYKRLESGRGGGPCSRMSSVVVSVKGVGREYLQWLLAVKRAPLTSKNI